MSGLFHFSVPIREDHCSGNSWGYVLGARRSDLLRLDQLDRFGFPRDYAAKCLPCWLNLDPATEEPITKRSCIGLDAT